MREISHGISFRGLMLVAILSGLLYLILGSRELGWIVMGLLAAAYLGVYVGGVLLFGILDHEDKRLISAVLPASVIRKLVGWAMYVRGGFRLA
jgi:hypothetical protein